MARNAAKKYPHYVDCQSGRCSFTTPLTQQEAIEITPIETRFAVILAAIAADEDQKRFGQFEVRGTTQYQMDVNHGVVSLLLPKKTTSKFAQEAKQDYELRIEFDTLRAVVLAGFMEDNFIDLFTRRIGQALEDGRNTGIGTVKISY